MIWGMLGPFQEVHNPNNGESKLENHGHWGCTYVCIDNCSDWLVASCGNSSSGSAGSEVEGPHPAIQSWLSLRRLGRPLEHSIFSLMALVGDPIY